MKTYPLVSLLSLRILGFIVLGAAFFMSALSSAEPAKDTDESAGRLREEFLGWRFGMFIHYNIATYNERQWATGTEDPASFNPDQLDCNQWIETAVAAGMKYAVLTVKHTGGWCLWDSKHTASHDITAFTNYKNGKGDIVREFVEACRKHGIKVGLYYCMPGDFAKRHLPKGQKDELYGLPPEARGDFTGFIKKQITELLSDYGPIDLLWFDQYNNKYTGDDWPEIFRHAKSIQPECIVIANNSRDFSLTDIQSYEYPFLKATGADVHLPSEDNKHPAEVSDKLGWGWFWTGKENVNNQQDPEDVVAILKLCNSRNANYLLNVGPDKSGLLNSDTVERLRKIGKLLAEESK